MTDPIEEARALRDYWRSIGWDDDAPAMVKVLALADECDRLRAELAAAIESDAESVAMYRRARDRAEAAESALAAAREAMPTQDEYDRVYDAFEGEIMEARKSRREWLAPGAAWLDRLHAYLAAQHRTPDQPSVGVGLDNGVPPSRGEIGGPSDDRAAQRLSFAAGNVAIDRDPDARRTVAVKGGEP